MLCDLCNLHLLFSQCGGESGYPWLTPLNVHFILVPLFFVVVLTPADTVVVGLVGLVVGLVVGLAVVVVFFVVKTVKGDVEG